MHLMYMLAIAGAVKYVDLCAAYFIPDKLTSTALRDARKRGARVRVLLPGEHIDSAAVRLRSRASWGELLEAGVEIYEYQPTMYHCKVMVVDGIWVSVGSTNFDNRSFRLNDEANLNVLDAKLAAEQTAVFEEDRRHARRMTLEGWRRRPAGERLKEWAAGLLRSQL